MLGVCKAFLRYLNYYFFSFWTYSRNMMVSHHCQCKNKCTGKLEALRVVQQQHYGVELLPGPIVRTQRDDEVIETISCRLRGHYNQLILEAICLGILKTAMCTALKERN